MQRLKKITYIYYFELSRTRLIYNHLYAVALSPIYYLVIIKKYYKSNISPLKMFTTYWLLIIQCQRMRDLRCFRTLPCILISNNIIF